MMYISHRVPDFGDSCRVLFQMTRSRAKRQLLDSKVMPLWPWHSCCAECVCTWLLSSQQQSLRNCSPLCSDCQAYGGQYGSRCMRILGVHETMASFNLQSHP